MEPNTEIQNLTEELGVYFEQNKILSPLSARIFSMLILTDKEGLAFDEIIEGLESCKSSVSTNLQLLQTQGRVVYFTKPGNRKRYFKIAPDDIFVQLDKKIEQWEKEKNIHLKVYDFKKKLYQKKDITAENNRGLQYTKNYALFIDDFIKNLIQLKENLQKTFNSDTI
ncbi:transcriptional regulator [Arenibacter sp. N53]|uniref:GbsR/MarR family transcriptional regulator n=1 Tax=Arenibacter TaxID=178469 RepID=UPI000CD4601F|nr:MULTISPECIES: transcriptional regulator [Arenibacter]MCM4150484.1 transcriptional regulator [Arenibacter sp. N53]